MNITHPMRTLCILFLCLQTYMIADSKVSLRVVSDAPKPYPEISGGGFTGPAVPESPDPLVAYRWPAPKASDGLQIYALKPVAVHTDESKSFSRLDSLIEAQSEVNVSGIGSIRMDFGQVNAGWLEFDSPDLEGDVELSISEYNEPAVLNSGPENPRKTKVPVKHGNTYRLELNHELYEGVRFGWIHVRSFNKPWRITGIRLVCQIKPTNYTGGFSCSDPELTRVWYTGAYGVKLNLLKDYFGAILMDRGDRISWTGDAHPSQAAALVALGNFDFIKTNLLGTSKQGNGIASYPLYWVLSLVDYFNYTGDGAALDQLMDSAREKLEAAHKHYDQPPRLRFYGWEERIGAGFENPDIPEARHAYAMLSIRAWLEFARAMEQHGRMDLRDRYLGYANDRISRLKKDSAWADSFGTHAAADAINAGFTSAAEKRKMFQNHFANRIHRLSYSPFNQYFIIQAMARMDRMDEALGTIKDCWGGQLRCGATTFFEVYDPSWNQFLGMNGAPPNNQCGYTSLCHPWGGGVVKWLTEETLGIKPTSPGFLTYAVRPHLGRTLTQVSGQVLTPKGTIAVSFDVGNGKCSLNAPQGTKGEFCIPKVEKTITSIRINGKSAWEGINSLTIEGIAAIQDEADFIRLTGVQPGQYAMEVSYRGTTPAFAELAWDYPVKQVKVDSITKGNWGGKYGHDGFVLCNYDLSNGKPADRRQLPGYVSAVKYSLNANGIWETGTDDPRAPAPDLGNGFPRNAGCIHTQDPKACLQTMTVDINLAQPKECQIALYFVDWDRQDRRVAVEMFDRVTLQRIAPVQMVRDFSGGKYLVCRYNKSLRFRIDQVRGDNATLSGIFFDSAEDSRP
jgi:alpha-L-rhamnosidase